jgi:hypothetical protein
MHGSLLPVYWHRARPITPQFATLAPCHPLPPPPSASVLQHLSRHPFACGTRAQQQAAQGGPAAVRTAAAAAAAAAAPGWPGSGCKGRQEPGLIVPEGCAHPWGLPRCPAALHPAHSPPLPCHAEPRAPTALGAPPRGGEARRNGCYTALRAIGAQERGCPWRADPHRKLHAVGSRPQMGLGWGGQPAAALFLERLSVKEGMSL